jgi:hypothetical protein
MSIETSCPSCGRLLRVADEHAGRQARCPVCNTIYVVPGPAAVPETPVPAAENQWYMKTPEQEVYGPVSEAELRRWLRQGRISGNCQLRSEQDAAWRPAGEYFGELLTARSAGGENPFAAGFSPAAAAGPAAGVRTSHRPPLAPHRGGLILVFGILAWSVCPIFGFLAWIMGSSDLRQMRAGRMDPRGESLTQVGSVLGMINVVLVVLSVGFFLLLFAAAW